MITESYFYKGSLVGKERVCRSNTPVQIRHKKNGRFWFIQVSQATIFYRAYRGSIVEFVSHQQDRWLIRVVEEVPINHQTVHLTFRHWTPEVHTWIPESAIADTPKVIHELLHLNRPNRPYRPQFKLEETPAENPEVEWGQ